MARARLRAIGGIRTNSVDSSLVLKLNLNSSNRDVDLDIDIALDRIRVGTNGMGALNKLFRRLLIYAGDSHGERSRQHKPTRVVAAEANLGDNFDVAIGKMAASLGAPVEERILKQAA